jgi:tRNA nucleotidyltransferase (CCA-adding enzyme)
LRAIRFASTLGFILEGETDRAVHACAPRLQKVSAERLRVELVKLLCGGDVVRVLLDYPDVLGVFLPEILPAVGCDQKNYHHCYDVWEHTARAVAQVAPEPLLRLTMLLHDLGKPACQTFDEAGVGHFKGHARVSVEMGEGLLSRLRFDNDSKEKILKLVKWHDVTIEPTERALRRALNRLGEPLLRALFQVKRADNLAQAPEYWGRQQELDKLEALLQDLIDRDACFSLKQLSVNGNDLMALGFRGRAVGQGLQALLDAVLDGKLPNDRAALLAAAEELKGYS